jgi:nitroreductase
MDTRVNVPVTVVRGLVARARLAPSTRNTQPWSWTVIPCSGDTGRACALELNRVRDRALELSDPGGRELVISCGAALLTLRVAAAEQLVDTEVEVLPDPARPDLLARVRFVEGSVDATFSGLDAAVPIRHTWRRAFGPRKLPAGLPPRLVAEVAVEGARLDVVRPEDVPVLATLVRASEHDLYADRQRRAELAGWLRPRWRGDGVPVTTLGVLPARLGMRRGLVGRRIAARDAAFLLDAPGVAILSTPHEDTGSWLAAGQALQRMLLVAAAEGVAAGFANGPCQDARRRTALGGLLGEPGHPQMIMRLGYPLTTGRAVPRRSLEDFLVWPGTGQRGKGSGEGVPVRPAEADAFDAADLPALDGSEDQLG